MKKKKYQTTLGARLSHKNAQIYGEELEKIANKHKGKLKAGMVVEEARNNKAPLHDYFEWDDLIAAEKWRIEQARYLIRHIKVIVRYKGEERAVRQFISLHIREGSPHDRIYIKSDIVAKDKALREQAIKEALDEFIAIQMKYKEIQELDKIFLAIDETQKELELRI